MLNKQNVETRRTNSFLRFAVGARSPDKKNYYKSKYFITPEETRLKLSSEQDINSNNKTGYFETSNNRGEKMVMSGLS